MSYLVFDIETIGKQYDEFDETSKEMFHEWAERDAHTKEDIEKEMEQIKKGLPFSPFLGEVVAIGMLDDRGEGAVYFRADEDPNIKDFSAEGGSAYGGEENGIKYRVGSEKEILERFWNVAQEYRTFVTFNGRGFDVPYLMIRSAAHGVRPSVNMMSNRYLGLQRLVKHIDLSDQLTFYGAMWRRPKLHFAAQAFGIESPKKGDLTGEEVPQAFREKKYLDIARYCMDDVVATKKLMETWDQYLNFEDF